MSFKRLFVAGLAALMVPLGSWSVSAWISPQEMLMGGVSGPGQASATFPLSVSGNNRYLQSANGQPFLLTATTAWAIKDVAAVTGPTGGTQANMQNYLATRASQGYNAVLIGLLVGPHSDGAGNAPFNSFLSSGTSGTCNGTGSSTLPDCYNIATPNSAYFQRLCGLGTADGNKCEANSIVGLAAQYNMLAIILPIDSGGCPASSTYFGMVVNNGTTAVTNFGAYLAGLFKNQPNVMWFGAQDFQCWQTDSYSAFYANVINGLRSGGDTHPATAQLNFNNSVTSDDSTAGNLGTVLNVNGVYTYFPNYLATLHGYNAAKGPALDVESNWEWENDGNAEPAWAACPSPDKANLSCVYEAVVRKEEWWAALSGSAGYIWGNHYFPGTSYAPGWQNEMSTEGATEFGTYWRNLLSANQWWNLVPDQTSSVLTNPGTQFSPITYPEFTAVPFAADTANQYSTAAYADSTLGSTVIVYDPGQGPSAFSGSSAVNSLTINMTVFGSAPTCQWYDPTSGVYTSAGSGLTNTGTHSFTPSGTNSTGDTDWVLLCNANQK